MMKHDFDTPINRRNTHSLKWDDNRRVFGYSIKSEGYYEAIINWIEKRHGWIIRREWIVSAPGVVPSLNMCVIAYTEPGDQILVQTPVYYPFFSVIENNKRKLINNPLVLKGEQYEMDYGDLEEKLASGAKMMIFCNPHNPGGRVWPREDVERVAALCLKHKTVLVSDEIHSDLIFPQHTHVPAAAISEASRENTITCFAPSKTFNLAGLAASYAVIPNRQLRAAYKKVMHGIGGDMSNIFGEIGLEAAYRHGEAWLQDLMVYLKENLDFMEGFITHGLPDIKVIRPQGTYLVWLDCRRLSIPHDALMNIMVKKAGVGLSSGAVFGQGGEGFLRMNIACPRSILEEGLLQIQNALR